MMRTLVAAALLTGLSMALACRANPGMSAYEDQEPFDFPVDAGGDGAANLLPGPSPYVDGARRLSIGIFYEGGSSEKIPIDNQGTHFFIYEGSADVEVDKEHIEGATSDAIVLSGRAWWGVGVHWDTDKDLRIWKTMHLALRLKSPSFTKLDIGMNSDKAFAVAAADYGFVNDDQWHEVKIPLADLVAKGLDLAHVKAALVLVGGPGDSGERLLVDDVYLVAE